MPGISPCAAPRGVRGSRQGQPGDLMGSAVSQPCAGHTAQPARLSSRSVVPEHPQIPTGDAGGMRTPAARAAPSFSAATVSLSSALKRQCGRYKTPPSQPCRDPCGASSALEAAPPAHAHLPHHLQATSKVTPRTPSSAWLSPCTALTSLPSPSCIPRAAHAVNALSDGEPFTLIPISSPPGAARARALCLIKIRSLHLLLHFFLLSSICTVLF